MLRAAADGVEVATVLFFAELQPLKTRAQWDRWGMALT
jgi:hypothetical protein